MSSPTLYKMDVSPPSCAVMIFAEMIGLKLITKDIDLHHRENKSPIFLRLNPTGTIPVLQDDDFVLADSHAIMKYLLTKHGGAQHESLYPSDLKTRALVDHALFFNAGILYVRVKAIIHKFIIGDNTNPTPQEMDDVENGIEIVEVYLSDRNFKFFTADYVTIADLAVGTTVYATKAFVTLNPEKYPRTTEWFNHLRKIPAFKKYCKNCVRLLENFMNMV